MRLTPLFGRKKSLFLFTLICSLLSFQLSSIAAMPSRFEVITFKPAIDGSDYFTVYDSQTLKKWQGNTGFYFDYANRPLQFVGLGGAAGERQSVIEHLMVADLYGSIGFTDWFEAGFLMPVVVYNWFFNDNTASINEDHGGGMGDTQLMAKFRVLNTENGPFGFAIMPFLTLPSGDPIRYTGNGTLTGGLNLIGDFVFHPRFSMALNVGGTIRDDVTRNGVRVDDQFDYGLGGNFKITDTFHAIAEVYGSTTFRDFFGASAHSPLEAGAGLRYLFGDSGFGVSGGATVGIIDGVGSPRFRVFTGLNWTSPGMRECPECPPPAPPPDPRIQGGKIVIWGKIYFDTDKATIKPISFPVLDDVVDVMQKNPQVGLVEVQGHCDSRGGDEYNMKLSQARSESVLQYLVSKGIEASRLRAVGYGLRKPIADNNTKEGMSQNRRVEFVIIDLK